MSLKPEHLALQGLRLAAAEIRARGPGQERGPLGADAAGARAGRQAAGQAEELAAGIEKLGPTFIKLAQLLSTRPDLVPPAYAQALALESGPSVRYEDTTALMFENRVGKFSADAGALIVEMRDHFASEAEARAVVDALLKAWEIETDLTLGNGTIRFRYNRADIIDREPPKPEGSATAYISGLAATGFVGSVTAVAVRDRYPTPPDADSFIASADVQLAHARWQEFMADREQLTVMAYFILTMLEQIAGGRHAGGQVSDPFAGAQ